MSSITALHSTIGRIAELLRRADEANRLPQDAVFACSNLSVSPKSTYGRLMNDEERLAALMAMKLLREQLVDQAWKRREDKLTGIALELDALRAVLPQQAAQAAIEAGIKAGEARAEAKIRKAVS